MYAAGRAVTIKQMRVGAQPVRGFGRDIAVESGVDVAGNATAAGDS